MSTTVPAREIRAVYTEETVTVYQAYEPGIGLPAAREGRFPPGWKRDRMTWIKPSFRWMMYRCGWGTKPGQETVLAVEMSRAGLGWALRHAALSHFDPAVHADRDAWRSALRAAPTRVQWDPERDLRLRPLDHRSLQLGLAGAAVARYADEWIVAIRDVTPLAHEVHTLVRAGDLDAAAALLPPERPYPVAELDLSHLTPPAAAAG
ncbi:DUF4291 family protein [Streptomyces sp. 3MP-14]|uniref:DUF4291 family protein n=1 Tax=Streptomyces mimosae TaxID=2586635 RepID=A0A5N6AQ55_9ACTN|nr:MULTISPECIES: DUF4291 domain-containing protein [Streptomyces]KAB8169829.1 DUF4291 family protein [Streptomyces mimosae]KAB8178577.1 DUF4291 family protein [Streptomyces sp. 3MP-14]